MRAVLPIRSLEAPEKRSIYQSNQAFLLSV